MFKLIVILIFVIIDVYIFIGLVKYIHLDDGFRKMQFRPTRKMVMLLVMTWPKTEIMAWKDERRKS